MTRGSIIDRFAPLDGAAIRVHQLRCAKVRNRNVKCLKCAQACTSGCISIEDGKLHIDARRCVGCGTCATVCPTCALESRNPSDAELINTCRDARVNNHVVLICEPAYRALASRIVPTKCVRVVCAGRIDESLLCELASQGVRAVHMICGLCDNCEQANGLHTAHLVIDTTHTLLQAWNVRMALSVSSEVPEYLLQEGEDSQKAQELLRHFFATKRTNSALDGALEQSHQEASTQRAHRKLAERMHVKTDGTLPQFIPNRRDQLLCSLSLMGKPNAGPTSTRLWGMVVIDESRCSSCQMCATFCPTGAIAKFEDEDGSFGVEHYPGNCVKCRSCEDICREGALSILDEVSPELLLEGEVRRYAMKPRPVELGSPQQMRDALKRHIAAPIRDFS